jgi:hypothetical protein
MKKNRTIKIITMFLLIWMKSVYAICPICTIAVGAGVGLAEWLGIDDTIIGLWIGGLTLSLIIWTISWFNKKNLGFFGQKTVISLAYYLMIVVPLYFTSIIGKPSNVLWGLDKLLLGIIFGSISFIAGALYYAFLKKHNNNRAYFPFQKVLMPVLPLIILSFVFYFITG